MTELTIVSPTHRRAGRVDAFKAFGPDLLLCVAASQVDEYRAAYPDARLDVHPDDVVGIANKRQWMADKYGTLFMVDDDVPVMLDFAQTPVRKLKPAEAVDVIHRLHDTAEGMGAFMFGTAYGSNPIAYNPHQPFRLTGVVHGLSMGLRAGHRVWFPKDSLVDDVFASGLNAYHHRFCLIDLRHSLPAIYQTPGGCSGQRTAATLERDIAKIKDAFGEAIVVKSKATWAYYLRVPW